MPHNRQKKWWKISEQALLGLQSIQEATVGNVFVSRKEEINSTTASESFLSVTKWLV